MEVEKIIVQKDKKRNPIVAAIFSLLIPGFGQFYNGQLFKSLILFTIHIIIYLIAYLSELLSTFNGFSFLLVLDIMFIIYNIIDAAVVAVKSKEYKIKPSNKLYWYIIIIVSYNLIYFASKNLRHSFYENYRVTSTSMENTFLIGDIVVCDKNYYDNHKIQRNDVIAFESNLSQKPVAYRVVGLPNDKIEIINKKIYVNEQLSNQETFKFINSRIVPREYGKLSWDNVFIGSKDNFGPISVPENQYFVLGDNFDVSADSRYYGCVQRDKILGKPLYIYFSFGKSPINDFKEYVNLNRNRKKEFRKSRVGKKIE